MSRPVWQGEGHTCAGFPRQSLVFSTGSSALARTRVPVVTLSTWTRGPSAITNTIMRMPDFSQRTCRLPRTFTSAGRLVENFGAAIYCRAGTTAGIVVVDLGMVTARWVGRTDTPTVVRVQDLTRRTGPVRTFTLTSILVEYFRTKTVPVGTTTLAGVRVVEHWWCTVGWSGQTPTAARRRIQDLARRTGDKLRALTVTGEYAEHFMVVEPALVDLLVPLFLVSLGTTFTGASLLVSGEPPLDNRIDLRTHSYS